VTWTEIPIPEEGSGVSEWQPIETAPKDGRFLVAGGKWKGEWYGTKDYSGVALVEADSFYIANAEYYSPCIDSPTHWQPLPEPPK
jgi:hypothetical protein